LSEEKIHSEIGASGASRWLACAGSVALRRPYPKTSGPAALEGTRLHELAEDVMHGRVKREDVPPEDLERIEDYLNVCQALAMEVQGIDGGYYGIELEVPLWYDPGHIGYIDFFAWNPRTKTMHVVDYKSGRVFVDERSSQLLIYACAVIEHKSMWNEVEKVVTHVVQPTFQDVHRYFPRGPQDALSFMINTVAPQVQLIREIDEGKLKAEDFATPGEKQCQYCEHGKAMKCEALNRAVERLAVQGMADLAKHPERKSLTDVLSKEYLAEVLENAKLIRTYLDNIEAYALLHIEDFPGWEAGTGLTQRSWLDKAAAAAYMKTLGINPYKEPDVITPAAFEKLKIEGTTPKERRAYTAEMAPKQPGKPKLVRAKATE
jgi:hypothetical protein